MVAGTHASTRLSGIARTLSDTVGIQPAEISKTKNQLGNYNIPLFYGRAKAKVAILPTASHL